MIRTGEGMGLIDDLTARAARLKPPLRTALLSECASRVLPVYEEYWVGDYYPSVSRSVELGWEFATGVETRAAELQTCTDEIQDLVTYYYEDATRNEVLASVVTIVLRLLHSITPDEAASCLAFARGLSSGIDAARNAEWMANWDTPREEQTDVARVEEHAWQAAALARIENWHDVVRRTMFDDLGLKPPAWLRDWRVRSANSR